MPTDTVSTILATGGDYASIIAWEAAAPADLVADDVRYIGKLGRNTDESPTLDGSTTDATRYKMLIDNAGDNIGRRCIYERASVVYGFLRIRDFARIEDIAITNNAPQAYSLLIDGTEATTIECYRVWVKGGEDVAGGGHGFRNANSNASNIANFYSCVAVDSDGGGFLNDGAGTTNCYNCLSYSTVNGIYQAAGTMTTQNCHSQEPANAAGTAYTGTITDTTSTSNDGSNSTTTITEAQWARKTSRLPGLRAYGTFENEPTALPGKLDNAAIMRETGTPYGDEEGDAALASDALTGTTGGIQYDESNRRDSIDSMSMVVRATLPASPTSVGLMQSKSSSDNNNRVDLYINGNGDLATDIYDSSANASYFQYGLAGGKCLLYKDFADNSADANHRRRAASLTGSLQGTATISGGVLTCDAITEKLNYTTSIAGQNPSEKGVMIYDVTHTGSNRGQGEAFCDFKHTGTNSNRVTMIRGSGGSAGKPVMWVYSSTASSSLVAGSTAYNSAGRRTWAGFWTGCDGSVGGASVGVAVNGTSPTTTTGLTVLRTELSTGKIVTGGQDTSTDRWVNGSIHRFATFSDTSVTINGNSYDFTSTYDANALWSDLATEYTAYQALLAALSSATINLGVRVHSGTAYLYANGAVNVSESYSGSRSTSDIHQLTIGEGAGLFLGSGSSISSWGLYTGATAPSSLPMDLYTDGTGVLDEFELTTSSHQTIKWGGTASGAPDLTVDAKGTGSRPPIGAFAGNRQPTVSPIVTTF